MNTAQFDQIIAGYKQCFPILLNMANRGVDTKSADEMLIAKSLAQFVAGLVVVEMVKTQQAVSS